MIQALKGRLRSLRDELSLPTRAKKERRRDSLGLPDQEPGVDRVIEEGIDWLKRAQDRSLSMDGGVARHFSLTSGWGTSYPETTGYIVPTLLGYAKLSGDGDARERAKRMLDWFVEIQLSDGGFQGGRIDSTPVVPVTFNTGQILLGLAAGVREFGRYEAQLRRAADWLVATQDQDGCWRKHLSPFARHGEKAYDTHAAWGLLEAARVVGKTAYGDAGLANIRWALTKQRGNGWIDDCCLDDASQPLTHTLGYALRGLIEAYRYAADPAFLASARRTADGLLGALGDDGYLPGCFYADWRPSVDWVCLTGTVQVAQCWLLLHQLTKDAPYLSAGIKANAYVRRTVRISGPLETRGGVKGSFPVDGDYGTYQYLNWAAKFCIDSQMLERELVGR
jgi:hypothetical protein